MSWSLATFTRWHASQSAVASGKVKISRRAPDGRENLQAVLGPSDMFGELAVFDPGPRSSSATAVTEVQAMFTDRAALRGWIVDHLPSISTATDEVVIGRHGDRLLGRIRNQSHEGKNKRGANQPTPLA